VDGVVKRKTQPLVGLEPPIIQLVAPQNPYARQITNVYSITIWREKATLSTVASLHEHCHNF
jgi:hypothetical protein